MKYIAVKPLNDSLKQTRRHFNERPTGVRMLSPICCVSPTLTINTDGVSLNKNSDVLPTQVHWCEFMFSCG